MPFVKLDCGILNSTIWFDREAREVFLTALLMAEPVEFTEPAEEIATSTLDLTGWSVPPGWYGFVHAASSGIIRRAGLDMEPGMSALVRLAAPDDCSRTPDFEGRRMVRVDGGFVILNYQRYRERDYTAAERQRRYREKQRNSGNTVTSSRNAVTSRHVTQAEAEVEVEVEKKERARDTAPDGAPPPRSGNGRFVPPTLAEVRSFVAEKGLPVDPVKFFAYYESNGWRVGRNPMKKWKAAAWGWTREKT